jgi:hypothetical protein
MLSSDLSAVMEELGVFHTDLHRNGHLYDIPDITPVMRHSGSGFPVESSGCHAHNPVCEACDQSPSDSA